MGHSGPSIENNQITFARRDTGEKYTKDLKIDVVKYVGELLETIQKDMYNKAIERQNKLTFKAKTLDEMELILNKQPGFIHADWCGKVECENRIKEIIENNKDKFTPLQLNTNTRSLSTKFEVFPDV